MLLSQVETKEEETRHREEELQVRRASEGRINSAYVA